MDKMIRENDYSAISEAANKMLLDDAKITAQLNEQLVEAYRKQFDINKEFHAKQQYADFVKAAMTGLLATGWDDEVMVANMACNFAEATLEEMTRRGK